MSPDISPEKWQKIKAILEKAIEVSPEEIDKFLDEKCGDDLDLRREVEEFLKESQSELLEEDVFSTFEQDSFGEEMIGRKIDEYEIISQIGEGGMGAVYFAEQKGLDFKQKVALKLIKRGMDTNVVLKRFLTERQILASLEHTNIARLLGGGSTPDNLPYFVMEHIEGEPIIDFCKNENLEIEQKLKLFLKVCDAVSYAHQKLIVHRDIKPSNIIVNKNGEPKLLDFGIGKILAPDWNTETAKATQTKFRLMTPEYASPEQIRGQMTTTSTDIYSLGIVLYELLTGTRPFKTDTSNPFLISEQILTEEPLRPSDAFSKTTRKENTVTKEENLRSLQGDLDNIVLKAIRKETDRRYRTVQEFADDIERYLKGLPVSATADSRSYRFKKFFQRNRAGVLTVTSFIVLLLAATTITGWQYYKAQKAQAQAEQRFNDVRKLARSVIFELHDSIEKLPGSTATRELLVSRALEYLDKLASEKTDDLLLLEELADAYQKIGDIQGNLRGENVGKKDKAFESYKKSLALKEKLASLQPNDDGIKEKLSESYDKLGDMFWIQANLKESLEMHGKSVDITEKFFKKNPNDKKIKLSFGFKLSRYGFIEAASGKTDQGLEAMQRSVKLLEELNRQYPEDREVLSRLSLSYGNVATTLDKLKQNFSESSKIHQKALKIIEQISKSEPENKVYKRNLAISYNENAELFGKLKDNSRALEASRKALELMQEIAGDDPNDKDAILLVAIIDNQYSQFLVTDGKLNEAFPRLERSLETLETLKKESPSDEVLDFHIAGVYENLGLAYVARALKQENLEIWRKARDYFQKSYKIYKYFKDAGITQGLDAAKADDMAQEIAKCDKILGKAAE